MSTILSKVLGNNAFYTDTYIKDTITLAKSILVKNHEEAKLYNNYLSLNHPAFLPMQEPTTWRYYLHLQGLAHVLDQPVAVVSVDNGQTFTLTRDALVIHKKTRSELLKFGLLYDTLVKKYPEQQLYIKAVALNPIYTNASEIVKLKDFTIVSYDKSYIEDNEHDVIPELQRRIDNYKSIWLIPYYQNLDNLFLATQYAILYQFLVTSLLAIRLTNAKTVKAHSFHIRLYLASHYRLDQQMLLLSRRQQLYLYRNLNYLSNHAGKNHVFRTLINELFNEHNISVVNYTYKQNNTVGADNYTDYVYNQTLLNSKSLVFTDIDYSLEYLRAKETPLAPGNRQEYDFNVKQIDRKAKHSLVSKLLTKDLETILIDETDSVKYKLADTITDYWAYLLKTNKMAFITQVTDPLTNLSVRLSAQDTFKLYVITLFASQGVAITQFPDYLIKRVFNPVKPTPAQLEGLFYTKRQPYRQYLTDICLAAPSYTPIITSFEFGEFVSGVYQLNIGLWHMLANYSDLDTEGQMSAAVDALTINAVYTYSDETVAAFLSRVGVKDPRAYDKDSLLGYTFSILDEVFDKKLSYIKRLKKLQQTLATVFFNFNSYTVQLINNYYNDSPVLAGIKDRRYGNTSRVKSNIGNGGNPTDPSDPGDPNDPDNPNGFLRGSHHTLVPTQILNNDPTSTYRDSFNVPLSVTNSHNFSVKGSFNIDALVQLEIEPYMHYSVDVGIVTTGLIDSESALSYKDSVALSFKTDIWHTGNKHYFLAELDFNSTINSKTSYTSFMQRSAEFSIGIDDVSPQVTPVESSDPVLLFLAINL